MNERMFLFVTGAYILAALYVEIDLLIYLLCVWLVFEAVTNIRLTTLSLKFIHRDDPVGLAMFSSKKRFEFEALRAARITIAIFIGGSLLLVNESNIEMLWFFPWFMGFAILGAGISGVCPMVTLMKWIGFR